MTTQSKKSRAGRRGARHASLQRTYTDAAEQYAGFGVDTTRALETLATIPISMQCWQGDDVGGFEHRGTDLGGGLAVTGNHPGKARTPEELQADIEQVLRLVPGRHRLNLHASYGEFGGEPVDRDAVSIGHFRGWMAWAKKNGLGLDFNPTCFAHPQAAGGLTLAHPDRSVRQFWIEHARRCREIGAAFGRAQGTPSVVNLWIPDGFKDTPADRGGARERLLESLDAVYRARLPERHMLDAVEPKLFGIGAEACTVGSHEFYLGYAITRRKLLCLDSGHLHPTETISDKISSLLPFLPGLLLHISRGVRWDSDHVPVFGDDMLAITREIVASGALDRIHIGLDYFDASINRVAAWVIGIRNVQKALLAALLEPPGIRQAERDADPTTRLALQEEARTLPLGAVWDHFCTLHNAPPGATWLREVRAYERDVLSRRSVLG